MACSRCLGPWQRKSLVCARAKTRINYLCACIAINLSLTIVFNINPKKRRKPLLSDTANTTDLEQWYIGSSIILGFGVILVPTVMGHFGKNTSRGSSNSFWYVFFSLCSVQLTCQLVQARCAIKYNKIADEQCPIRNKRSSDTLSTL